MVRAEANHFKKTMIEDEYLSYIDIISISDRNNDIVTEYINGILFKTLADKYQVSPSRIHQIVENYENHVYRYVHYNDTTVLKHT